MNAKGYITGSPAYELLIDEDWRIEVPVALREKLDLARNKTVEICFVEETKKNLEWFLDALEIEEGQRF